MTEEEKRHFKEFYAGTFEWVHVSRADEKTTAELARRYGFHELDLRDVLPPLQRPKVIARGDYLFAILLFPFYDRKTREIQISEVDFFIGKKLVVTVNHDVAPLPQLATFVQEIESDPERARAAFAGGAAQFFYELLERLLAESYPMLVHVAQDIDQLERRLWDIKSKKTVFEILRIRTNIVEFRRAIQWHKIVIEDLIAEGGALLEANARADYWNDLIVTAKEIWSFLETQRETINALHETHASLLSFHTNEVMKTLTIFSVSLLPLTLLVGLFGMNVSVPFGQNPFAFWIIVALSGGVLAILFTFFRNKQWL